MVSDFQALKKFDFANSTPHLWIFKDSSKKDVKFRTFYVQTENNLNDQFKKLVEKEIGIIAESKPYSYISQTNENSCLTIAYSATKFTKLKTLVDRLEFEHRIKDSEDLKGAKGYVVKFISKGVTVYAVKRSTSTWKTSYPKKYINMIFSNGELSGVEDTSFSIERNFDFYVINDTLFITNKRGFESVMQHRDLYAQKFIQLQAVPSFSNLFSDIAPIVKYVGTNSMQLRRMAEIKEKKIYDKPNFISNLMRVSTARGWGINFNNSNNTIIPCAATMKAILQALLDHRLTSEITNNTYDVPDATQV